MNLHTETEAYLRLKERPLALATKKPKEIPDLKKDNNEKVRKHALM